METSSDTKREKQRVQALRRYHILDTQEEQDFDDIVDLAAQICETPMALLTLLDSDRQWFKAKKGIDIKESPREIAFCAHTLHHGDIMIVNDTTKDERFFNNPFVTNPPYVQFYAGMPLITQDGFPIGALSVLDDKPRSLTDDQINSLRVLSKQVVKLLNLRYNLIKLEESNQKISYLANIVEHTGDAIISIDYKLKIRSWNKGAITLFGFSSKEAIGKKADKIIKGLEKLLECKEIVRTERTLLDKKNIKVHVLISITPLKNDVDDCTGYVLQFRDITERKHLENELYQTNNELQQRVEEKTSEIRQIIERVSDAFIALDNNMICTYANTKAKGLVKDNVEELVGSKIWNKFSDAVGQKLKHSSKNAMNIQKFQYLEILDTDNNRWYESHIYPSSTGLSVYFYDITERKEAEESVRQAKERYRSIFENALVGIYQSTVEGRFITLNSAMANIFGFESTKEMSTSITNIRRDLFADADDRDRLKVLLQKHGSVTNFEAKMFKRNKEIIWVQAQIRAIKSKSGELLYFEGILKEITERKKAENQILKEKEFSEAIINSLPGIFYLFDVNGRFLRWNKNFEHITGYNAQEIRKMHPLDFFDTDDQPLIQRNINDVFLKGSSEVEANLLTKDQQKIPFYFNGWEAFFENQPCLIGMAIDIVEQKQSEKKLKVQFQELQKRNHELDQFVYSVSHDLRAPLASVLGLINIASLENPPEYMKNYLEMIKGRINRLDMFIKDILDYSRNTRLEVTKERVDFQKLLNDIEEHVKLINEKQNLDIKFSIREEQPFYSDKTRIAMILNNLYVNAIKYQDVSKTQPYLNINITVVAEKAEIEFKDNGIGIPKNQLEKIFNMFYRASTISQGSGLGLYITKEAVNKLNGQIEVESAPGEYTNFYIELPNLMPKD
ncbi:MAG: sensor histidine kinase [Candidatus Cyclobacteriaceae bacterium M2_1C_046]